MTEKRQFELSTSKGFGSTFPKVSAGTGPSNVEECSIDGKVGKRHSNRSISRSALMDGKPPEPYSRVHDVGEHEEKASAWRRNQEEEAHQSSPHTSNHAGI